MSFRGKCVLRSHLVPSDRSQRGWVPGLGLLGPQSSLALACLSCKGLNFVLGSWLAVDRGWDRTSVCCYGCRTLEGDGWIIMANAAEQVSGCPEVAQDPCPPSAVEAAGPLPGQFTVGPVPRLQVLGQVEGSQPEPT